MAITYSNDNVRAFRDIKTITGATTLTAADTGKLLFLDAAEGATVTLPALKAGVNFKIVVADNFATSNWVVASAEGDNINGVIDVADAAVVAADEDQINFVNSAESKGDYIQLECDGNGWFVSGQAALTGAITATDPA